MSSSGAAGDERDERRAQRDRTARATDQQGVQRDLDARARDATARAVEETARSRDQGVRDQLWEREQAAIEAELLATDDTSG